MSSERLCLLQVHAHPDDEASKGAGTTAKYAAEGVHNVLVCCTGGEAGDILNPAVEHPGSPEAMLRAAHGRARARACDALGYASLHLLGYHDSGMPDTETNARPDNFANAPLDEAVETARAHHPRRTAAGDHHLPRRAELLSAPRPHPGPRDLGPGVRCWPAIPRRSRTLGEPWQPSKLYYVGVVDRARQGAARGVPRPRRGEPVRVVVRAWLRHGSQRRVHDARSTSASSCTSAARRCSRTARRSTRRVLDASARRRHPRGLPVGGVRARAFARRRHHRGRRRVRGRPVRRNPRAAHAEPMPDAGPSTMLVEFVVAAGQEGARRAATRTSTTTRVVGAADGPAPRPADIMFTVTPADADGAARRHARPLGRVHARPDQDGGRLRHAAALPAADRRRRRRRCRSPTLLRVLTRAHHGVVTGVDGRPGTRATRSRRTCRRSEGC